MIEIVVNRDGSITFTGDRIQLGNQYENNDETLTFIFPEEFDTYNKFLVAYHKKSDTTTPLPIENNQLNVSSALTYLSGAWQLYIMCKNNALNHVFMSNMFIGYITPVKVNLDGVSNPPVDTNFTVFFENIVNEIEDKIRIVDEKMENVDSKIVVVDEKIAIVNEKIQAVQGLDPNNYYNKEEVDAKILDKSRVATVEETLNFMREV